MGSCIAIKNFGWSVGAFGFMAGNVIFITAGLCASDLPMPSEICGLVAGINVPLWGLSSLLVGAVATFWSGAGAHLTIVAAGFGLDIIGLYCTDGRLQNDDDAMRRFVGLQLCPLLAPVTGPALCLVGNFFGLWQSLSVIIGSFVEATMKGPAKKKKA